MPTYDEIIEEAHGNLKLLHDDLGRLNGLKQEIEGLLQEPAELIDGFKRLQTSNEELVNGISGSVNVYLDGATALMDGLKSTIEEAEGRLDAAAKNLSEVNYRQMFDGLHDSFMQRTQASWVEEMGKLDAPRIKLKNLVEQLQLIVEQLEAMEWQKNFKGLKDGQDAISQALSHANTQLEELVKSLKSVNTSIALISGAQKEQASKIKELERYLVSLDDKITVASEEEKKHFKTLMALVLFGLFLMLAQAGRAFM
jgi:chromosome segregation ATPase